MTAPRTCRACGAALSPDLRWCGLCYAPAYELTPRAPMHDGDFVGAPIGEGGHRPHWSRWEKSTTTFGPTGRIVATALVVLTLPLSIGFGMFMYALSFPVTAGLLLSAIWAKGWVVPEEPDLPPLPLTEGPPPEEEPVTGAMIAVRIAYWVVGLSAVVAFVYGPVQAKAVVLGLTSIIGPFWLFDRYLSR